MKPIPVAALLLLVAGPVTAQSLRFGVQAVGISHTEASEDLQYDGGGLAGFVGLRVGRFLIEGEGYAATLDPDEETGLTESFDLKQVDFRVSFFVTRGLAIQVGGSGRFVQPESAAQDVGFIRIGVLSDNQIARIARLWVRGAYLPAPEFSGGGTAGFAFEIGLGTWIGTSNGRYGIRLEYDFQRIDRQVNDVDVPIQLMVAKVGIEVGF